MKIDELKDLDHIFTKEGHLIDEALKQGVRDALLQHKKDGLPIVISRDGQPVWVYPDELGIE